MPMNLVDMALNNFDRLCQSLDLMRMQSPEKYAFLRRLVTALEQDVQGTVQQQFNAEASTLRRLLDDGDIDAADRWLRRKLIRCV